MSEIKKFFKNQTIFITGATGFLGKVLLEKLLRECEDVNKIYILVRPKKGKTVQERYKDIFDFPCFDLIKSRNLNIKEKVFPIVGDCQKPLLDISLDDLEVLKKQTNLIIHMATNMNFDQSLEEVAFDINTTKNLLNLAKEMLNLKTFVYISTAFSSCVYPHIEEKIYEAPISAENFLKMVQILKDNALEINKTHLIGNWPNTYVFSKCISENLIANEAKNFPTLIVRPAIVTNGIEEPLPGWIDNVYGPISIVIGAGLGLLRSIHVKKKCLANMVPVDYVCNCILAATWKTATEKSSDITVYNYVDFSESKLNWGMFEKFVWTNYWTIGLSEKAVWYNTLVLTESKFYNDIRWLFLHLVPAYIIDLILVCLGKPKIAVKGYKKVHKMLSQIAFFSTHSWTFENKNVLSLWNEMNEDDKTMFNFDMKKLDWEKYIYDSIAGMKIFIVKEPVVSKNLRYLRVKMFSLFILHYTLVAIFWYLIYRFFCFLYFLFC